MALARSHFVEGQNKYRDGNYAGALADFEMANNIRPTPQAEISIARCLDALARPREAAEWYEKFLTHVPAKMVSLEEKTRARIAEIHAMPGRLRISSNPPGAAVLIDGRAEAEPTPLEVQLAPGSHHVQWTKGGHASVDKSVEIAFATMQSLSADLPGGDSAPAPGASSSPPEGEAAAPAPPPGGPQHRSKTPAYIMGAAAIVAAGAGVAFGLAALSDASAFSQNMSMDNASQRNTHALATDVCFGTALVFGIASIVLFLRPDEPAVNVPKQPAGHASSADQQAGPIFYPAPFIGPHGGGGGLVLRF